MKAWVLDTNVVVSGFLNPDGASARLLAAFFNRRLRLAYDNRMLAEYAEVLARPEFGLNRNDWHGFVMFLRATGDRISPPTVILKLPDPDDLPFIEVALATPGRLIVTKNVKHFQPAGALGLVVRTPDDAWLELD